MGLDIQANAVVATEVSASGPTVRRAAIAELPPGLMHEGEVVDPDRLAAELKPFFQDEKLSRRVRIGIANQRVVVRVFEVPAVNDLDKKELDEAVRFLAQEKLPMPLDEATYDYQLTERVTGEEGEAHDQVVLAAAPRDLIERYLAASRKAGLRLQGIDLSAFALIRALHGTNGDAKKEGSGEQEGHQSGDDAQPATGRPDGAVAYCHLGSVTSLAVAHGPFCLFARTVPYGLESIAGHLSEATGATVPNCHRWLSHVGLERDLSEIEGDAAMAKATREALDEGASRLASELETSLDYFSSQPHARSFSRTLVTGPGISVPGLLDVLAEGIPGPAFASAPKIEGLPQAQPSQLALAYGLSLEEAPS